MSAEPSASRQNDLDQWLKGLGFSRGNPFATAEADQERALLPEFYVDVDGYERIKGVGTVIVFAPRGGGKSALRVVLASQAAPIAPEATILAVEYTDFDALIAKRRAEQPLTIEDHVQRLLRIGGQALLNTFCGDLSLVPERERQAKDRQVRAARAAAVPTPVRLRLAQLLRRYQPMLLSHVALYERFQTLSPTFAPTWSDFVMAVDERRLRQLLAGTPLQADEMAGFLADLNDYPNVPFDEAASPTEQLRAFVSLAKVAGFTQVNFLIDRVDENPDTAADPSAQADILEPLLAHLPLLETPGAAFKFFLSREARDVLLKRPKIRRDRLTDQAVTVTWDKDRLKGMLDARLAVYSEEQVSELIQLCQGAWVEIGRRQVPRLFGEWLEAELLQVAQYSPRRLLIALQLLGQAHVQRVGPNGLLEQADWEVARLEVGQKLLPQLHLQPTVRKALIGDREISLTPQEHQLLLTLASQQGHCSRQKLVETVWGAKGAVSEEAIDATISRLRKKLADDSSNPVYLRTLRDQGFELLNYEVENWPS